MRKLFLLSAFLFSMHIIGQETDLKKLREANNLEEYTYTVLDMFLKNPTEESLKSLPKSLWRNPKNDAEKLASVVFLCNRGYYENQFGHSSSAVESYENAWQIYGKNKLSDYDIVEFCLKPLGNLYIVLGDYDNAENTIKQYYFISSQQKNQLQKIAAVLNLSTVYQNSGKVELSIELLENTLRTEKTSVTQKGKILNNLGASYLSLQNWQKAKNTIETAVELLRKDKYETESLSNSFRNLASVYSELNENEKAISYFEQARLAFLISPKREPRKHAKLYYDGALILLRNGKTAAAKENIQVIFKILIPDYTIKKDNLPKKESLYAETVLLDVLDLQAKLFSEEKRYEKALETYALSFHIEELFAPLFVYENTKLLTQIRNRKRTEKCISIYGKLHQKDKNNKWIESAFLLSEQTKSVVLKEHIFRSNLISAKEKQILKQLQDWNNLILKEQQKLENANISKINEAIHKQNELVLLLKSIQSERDIDKEQISIQDLHQKLAKDNARMISYFAGFEKLYSFSIDQKFIRLQILDKSAYGRIFNFVSYFDNASAITDNVSGYQKSALEVYSLLKIPPKHNIQNMIIIPDGLLNFVPFEALLTKNSSTANFSKMPYLLNDYKIGYNNSVAFYLDKLPFHFKKETVLGIFPVFENSALELSFSKQELASIKPIFKGNYLENKDADFQNFKLYASAYSILHLSTHASAGDIETPSSIRFSDGEILYSELYNLDIHPDLVVLSACETGIGKLYKGEGSMSVARGFQFAGAKNLLFSLWEVNDFTTSVQMGDFYKSIKNDHSYFDSNHLSKIEYLNNDEIPNTKKSPYYWSAMVYYGTLESKPQTHYLWIIWLVLIAIALFLVLRKLKKQNSIVKYKNFGSI